MADKFTEQQYQTLLAAYSTGSKMVRYEDHWVEYRSLTEMKKILTDMENFFNSKDSNTPTRQIRVVSNKGL